MSHRIAIRPIGIVAAALSPDARVAMATARRLGFTGLQFDAVTSGADLTDLSATGRREFRQVLSQHNQTLIGLRSEAGPKGLMPGADIDRVLWRWDRVLEAAAGLEARLVCLDLGPLPAPAVVPVEKPAYTSEQLGLILPPPQSITVVEKRIEPVDEKAISHVDSALAALGQMADRYGVTVAMRSDLSSLAALHRAIAAVSCPWFAVDFDPVSILRDEWPLDEMFSRLGQLIRHLRGHDALAGDGRRTRPASIGNGSTHWPALLSLLDEAAFNGWITIDPIELPDRIAGAMAGLKYLKSLDEIPTQ